MVLNPGLRCYQMSGGKRMIREVDRSTCVPRVQ